MPWHVTKSDSCPVNSPWAVIKDGTSDISGCHESQAAANDQMAVLYAAEEASPHADAPGHTDNGNGRSISTPVVERRDATSAWPTEALEIRADSNGMTFRGYAAVFDTPSEDLGGFRETIRPGAFGRSLNAAMNGNRDIRMFLNHNADVVLASTRAKTLRLVQDQRGLLAEADLPSSPWGQSVAEAVRRGDISSMSFGFVIDKRGVHDSWSQDGTQRTLHEVRLLEVSPVTGWPAYTATTASVRALIDAIDWQDEETAQRMIDGLNDEQRSIMLRLLNRQSPAPLIDPEIANARLRLEALKARAQIRQ